MHSNTERWKRRRIKLRLFRVVSAFASLFRALRKRAQDAGPAEPLFTLDQFLVRPRWENEARIRRLCHSVHLGEGTALCRVLGRYKMFVDTTDHGLSPHLMLDGYWEMWLTEALVRTIRPGMTVVDVGANLGYFTLLMADLVGDAGRVIAFEPNPPIAARLCRTLALNGFTSRTQMHECALADTDGREALLVCPDGEPKNAYLAREGASRDAPNVHVLATRRLDSFPEAAQADVIKIDADTAEEAIWRGMSGLLRNNRPMTIFLEFAAVRYSDPAGFLRDIQAANFSIGRVELSRGMQAVEVADILSAAAHIDQMLVLRR